MQLITQNTAPFLSRESFALAKKGTIVPDSINGDWTFVDDPTKVTVAGPYHAERRVKTHKGQEIMLYFKKDMVVDSDDAIIFPISSIFLFAN